MNPAQIGGIIRALMAGFSFLAIKYGFDEATWTSLTDSIVSLTGAAVAVGTIVWSYHSNSTKAVVEQAAKAPEVTAIFTEDKLANSIDSGKVIPADPVRLVQ